MAHVYFVLKIGILRDFHFSFDNFLELYFLLLRSRAPPQKINLMWYIRTLGGRINHGCPTSD
jgi:hypothetical protein